MYLCCYAPRAAVRAALVLLVALAFTGCCTRHIAYTSQPPTTAEKVKVTINLYQQAKGYATSLTLDGSALEVRAMYRRIADDALGDQWSGEVSRGKHVISFTRQDGYTTDRKLDLQGDTTITIRPRTGLSDGTHTCLICFTIIACCPCLTCYAACHPDENMFR